MTAPDAINRLDVTAVLELTGEDSVFEPLRSATEGCAEGRAAFRDGVLVHYQDYGDARLALEAAGLSR